MGVVEREIRVWFSTGGVAAEVNGFVEQGRRGIKGVGKSSSQRILRRK
jgi:hypothetical protein